MRVGLRDMTKYILVGGYPHKAADTGKAFAEELVKDFNEPIKLLDCLFARPKDNWDIAYNQDIEFFHRHLPGKKLDIVCADPDKFIEQVRRADAIYIRGGDAEDLLIELLKHQNLQNELDGKTLAGSSAGAGAIAKYYYALDDLKIGEGLGLLPIKVLVHYRSDYNAPNINWDKVETELKNHKENLQFLTLKEGQFEIVNT